LPAFSTAMPCRLSLLERDGVTRIAMLQPTALAALVSDAPEAGAFAQGVQDNLVSILTTAAQREVSLEQALFDVNLPYKVALSSSNKGEGEQTRAALRRVVNQWASISQNATFKRENSPSLNTMTSSVQKLLDESLQYVVRADLPAAHNSLEGVRRLWAEYRSGSDMANFTDALFYFHEAMEEAIKAPASVANAKAMSTTWEKVTSAKLPQVAPESAAVRRQLLDSLGKLITQLNEAGADRPKQLESIKRLFVTLYLQFG
jgi:hypothetical protein